MAGLTRNRTGIANAAITASIVLVSGLAVGEASAQFPDPLPERTSVDARSVNLLTGTVFIGGVTDIAIGDPGAGGLAYARTFTGAGWRGNATGTISVSGSSYSVSMGTSSDVFTLSGSTYTDNDARGATLTYDEDCTYDPELEITTCTYKTYTYKSSDGVIVSFNGMLVPDGGTGAFSGGVDAVMTQVTYPNGESVTYHYKDYTGGGSPAFHNSRLQSITNNYGFQLHFEYHGNGTPVSGDAVAIWRQIKKITAVNTKVESCGTAADTCSGLTETWPTVTYTYPVSPALDLKPPLTVTDAEGRTTTYTYNIYSQLTSIKRPSASSADITYTYSSGKVSAVAVIGESWSYAYADASGDRTTTVTDPNSETSELVSEIATGLVQSMTDQLSRTVSYTYDGSNRLTRVTQPEENYVQYAYDSRGNVTSTTAVAKSGSGLANIVTSATYASTCSNQKTCNKPEITTDARGEVTNYTYDSGHGGVLTITAPAPVTSGIRPKATVTYTSVGGVYLVSKTAGCATTASCADGADETQTVYTYETSSSSPHYRRVNSVTSKAGNSAVTSTSAYTYDSLGRVITVDGPLSGTADTAYFHYDLTGLQLGVVGPDPDGGGSLKYRAARTSYNADGVAYLSEAGTVTSTSSSPWDDTFTALQKSEVFFDSYSRPVKSHAYDGVTSTVLSLTQTSYDDLGRTECTALRMNPASFSSPPASACTKATSGAYGADRISKAVYDEASQIVKTISAYDTSLEQDSVEILTRSDNGLPLTMIDAAGNKTTYAYDGFDRVAKMFFPHKATVGTSSTTDYYEYTYGNSSTNKGLLTALRLRDGTSIAYTYDKLGRMTEEDHPGSNKDLTYTYDSFSRVLTVADGSQTLTYAYDQLSRLTSETHSVTGAVGYSYDAAGQLTQIAYPGSFNVNYAYDTSGAMTTVKENGSTTLATYTYDDLGRRASLTRLNGVTTTYGYDGGSRLTSLAHDLPGTTHDQTWTFTYNAASQIVSESSTNGLFDWVPGSDFADYFTDNGLNQYATAAGASVSHDNRANTTDISAEDFTYNSRNQLTESNSGADTLSYDPAGRLYEEDASATTRFLYTGDQAIAEVNGSNAVQRRYVRGAGVDEPLVWYEGSGTSDRRFLLGDIRGSIAAVTNGSGVATNVNTYDEYGVPGSSNAGRFGFTGQMYLPDQGLYHYKARAYNPASGRFMQPDPIGYGDGMNMYAYVGNDPVNNSDPSGLFARGDSLVFGSCAGGCADSKFGRGGYAFHLFGGGTEGGGRRGGGGSSSSSTSSSSSATVSGDTITVTGSFSGFNHAFAISFSHLSFGGSGERRQRATGDEIVVTGRRRSTPGWDEGLSPTWGMTDCPCLPDAGSYFHEDGLVIVAKRINILSELRKRRSRFQSPSNGVSFAINDLRARRREAVCAAFGVGASGSFLEALRRRNLARAATSASARAGLLGVGLTLGAYVACEGNVNVESN